MTPKEYAQFLVDTVNRNYLEHLSCFEDRMFILEKTALVAFGDTILMNRAFSNYYSECRYNYFYEKTKITVYDEFGFFVPAENDNDAFYDEVFAILSELVEEENGRYFAMSCHTDWKAIEFWRVDMLEIIK